MVTIAEAKEQIEQAKQQVAEQKRIAEENQRRIEEARRNLPNETSQMALRKGTFSGIKGRLQRGQVSAIRSDLGTKEQLVSQAKQELERYSRDLSSYEQQIKDYEQAQAQIQAEQNAFNLARKLYNQNVPSSNETGAVRKYMRAFEQSEGDALASFTSQVNSLQRDLPSGEKLVVDYNKMKISGIQSEAFGESLSISDYNKKIEALNRQATSMQEKIDVNLPNLEVQEAPKTNILSTGFGIVSAQEIPSQKKDGIISKSLQKVGNIYGSIKEKVLGVYSYDILRGKGSSDLSLKSFVEGPETLKQSEPINLLNFVIPSEQIVGASTKILSRLIIPTREVSTTTRLIEVQRPANIFGKDIVISKYQLTRETAPPRYVLSNKGSGILGTDDILKLKPAKVETTIAQRVIGDNPFTTYTTKFGESVKGSVLSGYSQPSVPTNVVEFEQMSRTQKFLWQRVAEDIAGRPVALKNVPSILSQNEQQALGYINQQNLGRLNLQNMKETPLGLGKTTKQYQTASSFAKTGETPTYEVYQGKIFFKDVTKPFSRASGKTPIIEGSILRIKDPLIVGEDTGISIMRPSGNIKRTPLSSTFDEPRQISAMQVNPSLMPVPKTTRAVTTTKSIKSSSAVLKYGNLGLSVGVFGGKSGSLLDKQLSGNIISDFDSGRDMAREEKIYGKELTSATSLPSEGTKQPSSTTKVNLLSTATSQKPLQEIRVFGGQTNKEIQRQIPRSEITPKEIQKLNQNLIIDLSQKNTQKQKITQRRSSPSLRVLPKQITRPKPILPILNGKARVVKISEGNYLVEIRRFGSWFSIGNADSIKEATKIARNYVEGTLGASLRISKEGRTKNVGSILGFNFRPSKREKNVFVQVREMRLSSVGERREIKSARKNKTSKRRKIDLFGSTNILSSRKKMRWF